MTFKQAKESCHVRSAIYRKSNPKVKYWKNHSMTLDEQVPIIDQQENDWFEYDPRQEDESSLSSFND